MVRERLNEYQIIARRGRRRPVIHGQLFRTRYGPIAGAIAPRYSSKVHADTSLACAQNAWTPINPTTGRSTMVAQLAKRQHLFPEPVEAWDPTAVGADFSQHEKNGSNNTDPIVKMADDQRHAPAAGCIWPLTVQPKRAGPADEIHTSRQQPYWRFSASVNRKMLEREMITVPQNPLSLSDHRNADEYDHHHAGSSPVSWFG